MSRRGEPGLLDSLWGLGDGLFGMLQHRLELASLELGEAGERLVFAIVASMVGVVLLGGAVIALSAWVAVALWPTLGHAVLGWLALVYGLSGAGLLWWLSSRLRNDPPLLADTLAELRADAAFMRADAATAGPPTGQAPRRPSGPSDGS